VINDLAYYSKERVSREQVFEGEDPACGTIMKCVKMLEKRRREK
jgi:hypothetical protein